MNIELLSLMSELSSKVIDFNKLYDVSDDENDSSSDLEIQSDSSSNRLLIACEKGDLEQVKNLLLDDQSLVKCFDTDAYTPLHKAASTNHCEVAKLLLKNGASLESRTLDGWTPLHSACHWNNYECVALLVESGSDINSQTKSGQTPIHLAAANPSAKETLKILLMSKFINRKVTNSVGETAKQIAIRSGPFSYMFETWDLISDPLASN